MTRNIGVYDMNSFISEVSRRVISEKYGVQNII